MSDLRHIQGDLGVEWSKLQASWEAIRQKWRDEVASDFERRCWLEWEERVPAFLQELEKIEAVISSALRDT